METKRAGMLLDRFTQERRSGSVLTGPRLSAGSPLRAAWESKVLNAPDVVLPSPSPDLQDAQTGVTPFMVGYSAIGDGSPIG